MWSIILLVFVFFMAIISMVCFLGAASANRKQKYLYEIHNKFPIGSKIKYLGATMTVIRHGEYLVRIGELPAFHCRYLNSAGQFEDIILREGDMPMMNLIHKTPPTPVPPTQPKNRIICDVCGDITDTGHTTVLCKLFAKTFGD